MVKASEHRTGAPAASLLGAWVIARAELKDDAGKVYAEPGHIGHVIDVRHGYCPTIAWERTGTVCDTDPSEFEILCGPGFAKDEASTPVAHTAKVARRLRYQNSPKKKGKLIALSGRAGSGKSTLAGMLRHHEISFAEPLKKFAQEVFDFTDAQIYGPSAERSRPDARYTMENGEPLTARHALQTLGTEWGRSCFPDVWAALGVRRALAYMAENPGHSVVIPDCRFVNEARAVREAGGQVWRIVRPGAGLDGAAALHPSEMEQESPEFLALVTQTIKNTGSLMDLSVALLDARGTLTL